MPEFHYQAKNPRGVRVEGSILAPGRREALAALAAKSLFPLKVTDSRQSSSPLQGIRWTKRVNAELLADNLSQLADLLTNGVPLLRSLEVLASQVRHEGLAETLTQVRDDVADGATLDEAMAKHPRVFSELIVNMVHAGGAGAFLEEALQRTADFLVMQEELKRKVKGAMAYPVFLAITGMVVTVALIVFFVPKFAELFAKLESQGGLPWATKALLWMSDSASTYGVAALIGLTACGYGASRFAATDRGKYLIDAIRLRAPLFGPIAQGYASARFCRVLGTLLRNGVPLLKSLDISSRATANMLFAETIRASAENVSSGDALAEPLGESGLFAPSVMAMIRVAEEANNLDHVLLQIAERIERRNGQQLEMLVRLLEPALLLLMGVVMLFVIVALLLPVFDMSSAVG
ncbi:MAG: type II secretion system F family protein [Planctomycetales bacterium]|nr:type II secretion system F family protein [Planctomycetales bacterium]